jgi:hypothetical protein
LSERGSSINRISILHFLGSEKNLKILKCTENENEREIKIFILEIKITKSRAFTPPHKPSNRPDRPGQNSINPH